LGAWTSFSTINDDVIQPSRKLPLEVSDPNLSSFIIVYLILVCHTRSMVGTLTLDLYAFFVCAYMCLKVEQYKNWSIIKFKPFDVDFLRFWSSFICRNMFRIK
jgi:hypothetical protein